MSTRPSAAPATEPAASAQEAFARDVRDGLTASPKRLPPRWLYDPLGSALFEAIGQLPWYRITRAELALLARCGPAIAAAVPGPVELVELGVGDGRKLLVVAHALAAAGRLRAVHLVDVAARALDAAARSVTADTNVPVIPHEATFEEGLARATEVSRPPRLVLFLGSNVGNYDPPEARALICRIEAAMAPADQLLLGVDLVKPERDLRLAYDDPVGVTAAFNRNVLQRINAELGASFDLRTFNHEARWNAERSRVEMHLVSTVRQEVRVPGAGFVARFERGESIWTESSYKYEPGEIAAFGASAGLAERSVWLDPAARFALTLFEVADPRGSRDAGRE